MIDESGDVLTMKWTKGRDHGRHIRRSDLS